MDNGLEDFKARMRAKFEEKLEKLSGQRLIRLEELENAVEEVEREMSCDLLEGLLNLKKTAKSKNSQ